MKQSLTIVAILIIQISFAQGAGTANGLSKPGAGIQHSFNADSLKQQAAIVKKANIELAAKTNYNFYIIKVDSSTYGYSIFGNGQLYIWQTTIPGIKGSKGFSTKEAAERCAQLIIQKIKQGEMPPTVAEKELIENKLIN